jgi:hypothetical protein
MQLGRRITAAMERVYPRTGLHADETPSSAADARPPNWVDDLVAVTRPGAEIRFPTRDLRDRVIPFEYDDFS